MRLLCCCFAAAALLLLLCCCCFAAAAALLLLLLCCCCCCFAAAAAAAAALAALLLLCDTPRTIQVSTLVAALWQSSSVDLLHEPQATKSVQAHLCKLSSLSFVVTAVLSSAVLSSRTDGRASKPNVPAFSVLAFARVADCSKYAENLRNAEPEAGMFTCCADRGFTFLEVKF